MFDTRKFGGFLSRLRKAADMTQSELADRLSVTRQAVSKWEIGDSFPDVSILLLIAKLFDVTLDELISAGAPTRGEAEILQSVARGGQPMTHEVSDLIGVAPLLRPSVLDRLSAGLAGQGIDISNLVELAEFLSDERTLALMEGTALDAASPELLARLAPFLTADARTAILDRVLAGEIDWHIFRHLGFSRSLLEAAVLEGMLPWEALWET